MRSSRVEDGRAARARALDAVIDALERNAEKTLEAQKQLELDEKRIKVFATSDLHTDMPKNMQVMEEYVERETAARRARSETNEASVIVVAGDVGTNLECGELTLRLLSKAHDMVCYLPAGNHELGCATTERWCRDNGREYPCDSIGKMLRLIDLCTDIGVCCSPLSVAGVRIVPIYGWYDDLFAPRGEIPAKYSDLERRFDCACSWPSFINPPSEARNSHSPAIGAFMRAVNDRVLDRFQDAALDQNSPIKHVITYSHFIPRSELYRGTYDLVHVMGSCRIDADAKKWKSTVHVFGHSHLNVDRCVDGVRYIQCALGYPHERWFGVNHPKLVFDASLE